MQGAVLQRGSELDVIIQNKTLKSKKNTIATGSLRRKAQWLNKFKTDSIVEIRGNVQTRLRKLNENNWNGTIMAKAGLERLDILPIDFQDLNWMVPAPAQGAISVQNLTINSSIAEMLRQINPEFVGMFSDLSEFSGIVSSCSSVLIGGSVEGASAVAILIIECFLSLKIR
jgi:hydroxymethylbilane synthase